MQTILAPHVLFLTLSVLTIVLEMVDVIKLLANAVVCQNLLVKIVLEYVADLKTAMTTESVTTRLEIALVSLTSLDYCVSLHTLIVPITAATTEIA